MDIKLNTSGDQLVISLVGRLDTTSAPALTQCFAENLSDVAHLILDFDELEFVSSAGLRSLLMAQKQMNKQGDMVLRHVSPSVMEVFEMTGFSDILTIEKAEAIRQIQLDTDKMLGRGAYGAVYQYREDSIVKIYFRESALEEIELEKKMSREALILGVPTAISLGIVISDGKYGLEYEFIKSRTMAGEMVSHPEKWDVLADQFVELAKILHDTPHQMGKRPSQFPATKDIFLALIHGSSLGTPEFRNRCIAFVQSIPDGNTLVHGDFHPGNVMLSGDEPLLIDIADLSHGHPIFDLALTYRALHLFERYFYVTNLDDTTIIGLTCRQSHALWDHFFLHYFDPAQQGREEIFQQIRMLAVIHGYFLADQAPVPFTEDMRGLIETLSAEYILPYLDKHTGNVNW